MVTDYGMSERVGPVSLGGERAGTFVVAVEGTRLREHGDEVADLVDGEVRRLLESAEGEATEILTARRGLLDRVAEALLEREALDGDELRALLQGVHAAPVAPAGTPTSPGQAPAPEVPVMAPSRGGAG
jgi:cell division protease FtsH